MYYHAIGGNTYEGSSSKKQQAALRRPAAYLRNKKGVTDRIE